MAIEYKPANDRTGISDEELKVIQDHMKATSKRPNKIPRKIYHATPQSNLSSILEHGLKPHEIFGEIYFCEKEKQCQKFIPSPAIIFCIDTTKLDLDLLYQSADHVKTRMRNFEAFTYYGSISPELCKNWRRV